VMYLAADEQPKGIAVRLGQLDGFARDALESPHNLARKAFAARLRLRPELMVVDPFDARVTLEDADQLLLERAKDRIRVLIVDSLQTIPCAAANAFETARDRMTATIEACKRAAKRGAIVIAISEMSRGGYRTGDRATDTSALSSGKESGAIEYGGAFLLGLRSVKGEKGVIEIECAKNRVGNEKPDLRVRINFERASLHEVDMPAASLRPSETKADERMAKAKARIAEALRQHHDLTSAREVLAHVSGSRNANADALRDMQKRGEVVELDGALRLQLSLNLGSAT
jgi:hypothetical protein